MNTLLYRFKAEICVQGNRDTFLVTSQIALNHLYYKFYVGVGRLEYYRNKHISLSFQYQVDPLLPKMQFSTGMHCTLLNFNRVC